MVKLQRESMPKVYLIQVGITQNEVPFLHFGAKVDGGIRLHPIALDAVWRETCRAQHCLCECILHIVYLLKRFPARASCVRRYYTRSSLFTLCSLVVLPKVPGLLQPWRNAKLHMVLDNFNAIVVTMATTGNDATSRLSRKS